MSHEITDTDGILSVREMPWHGLGHVLTDYPTREEAQRLVHPWEPVKVPVYTATVVAQTPDGGLLDYQPVEGQKAVQRSDNGAVLGVVNDTLGLVTNNDLWDVAEAVGQADGGIQIETAGSLDGGRKVWALLRFTEPLTIAGDPNGAVVPYFALQNAHDGSGSFRGQAINTRIVCANTSRAADVEAKGSGYEFTFRHTRKVSQRVEEAKAAVALWREGVVMWQTAMEHLAGIRITREQVDRFITEFHPMPPRSQITARVEANVDKARAELTGILYGETCDDVTYTAYGLVQAGIEWSQHYRRTNGKTDRVRMENHFKRAMLTTDRLGSSIVRLAQECAVA